MLDVLLSQTTFWAASFRWRYLVIEIADVCNMYEVMVFASILKGWILLKQPNPNNSNNNDNDVNDITGIKDVETRNIEPVPPALSALSAPQKDWRASSPILLGTKVGWYGLGRST